MAWSGLKLTRDGRNMLSRAQLSQRLRIKSIVVGDGNPPQNYNMQTALVHELFAITNISAFVENGICVVEGDIPQMSYNYYFREIGIIASTDAGEDRLYVYDNCGDDAQYIVNTTSAEHTEKRIRLSLIVSDVANITVENPSVLYLRADGGNVSNTVVTEIDRVGVSFPIPEPGDSTKRLWGKVKKWQQDYAAAINQLNTVVEVNVPAAGWTGSGSNFMNQIQLNGFSNDDRPEVLFISDLFETDSDTGGVVLSAAKLATLAARKKAFACLSGAVVSTEGLVIFASKRPAVDFKIGLKGGAARDYEPNDSDGGEPGDGRELSENSLSEIWDTVSV